MGLNDGGIKRGDREETGDLEAQPTDTVDEHGSGASGGNGGPEGYVTGRPDALGAGPANPHATRLDSLAGSSLSPDMTAEWAASIEEDPDLGQTRLQKYGSEDAGMVDDPSGENDG